MAKPRAVAKQVQDAENAHKETYQSDQTPQEFPQELLEQEAQGEEAGEVSQIRPDEPAPAQNEVEPEPGTAAWEQKYRTLDGKYKAEVPRLHEENESLRSEVTNLQQILANFSQDAATEVEVPIGEPLIRPDEIEDYGEDLISVVKRAAREEMTPELARLQAENARLKESLTSVSSTITSSAREGMYRQLDAVVPDWRDVNKSQPFLDWLTQRDVYSGASRQQMLTQAFEANDTARVLAFFKGYKHEQTVVSDEGQAGANQGSPLETFVAPGRPSATGAAGARQEGRIWTQAEIAAFYANVNKGRFKGREKEKNALEQDIVNASVEGRIR